MKVLYFFIWISFLLQNYSQGAGNETNSPITLECITFSQLFQATAIACKQKDNYELWQQIIKCHRPMTDQFMRISAEARCPEPKHVEDPTDKRIPIQKVFFNVCGLIEGNSTQQANGLDCLTNGRNHPFIMNHKFEVSVVELFFGKKVPCNIGECIKKLFSLV